MVWALRFGSQGLELLLYNLVPGVALQIALEDARCLVDGALPLQKLGQGHVRPRIIRFQADQLCEARDRLLHVVALDKKVRQRSKRARSDGRAAARKAEVDEMLADDRVLRR